MAELRRKPIRLYNGGPVVRVRQELIGDELPAYREHKLSTDTVTFLRRWAVDVRSEYRRACARRSFFRFATGGE